MILLLPENKQIDDANGRLCKIARRGKTAVMRVKKTCICFAILCFLFCFTGCANVQKQVQTSLNFQKKDVYLLTETLLAYQHDDAVEIYQVDRKTSNVVLYDTVEGGYEIADVRNKYLLLQNKSSLCVYDFSSKKLSDYSATVFSPEEKETALKYQSFFAGNYLILTKVIFDVESPILFNETQIGYQVAPQTGVYVYQLNEDQLKCIKQISLEEIGLSLQNNEQVSFTAVDYDGEHISLTARVSPVSVPFYSESYYMISLKSGISKKLWESPLSENQQVNLQYSYLRNRLVKADSKGILCVDFESNKATNFEFEKMENVTGVDILDTGDKNFFFVCVGTKEGDHLFKFKIVNGVLNCERANKEMLASESLLQNAFARGNQLYFPSDEEARQYGTLFVNGTGYRSYSSKGYLCDSNGKTVVIFE